MAPVRSDSRNCYSILRLMRRRLHFCSRRSMRRRRMTRIAFCLTRLLRRLSGIEFHETCRIVAYLNSWESMANRKTTQSRLSRLRLSFLVHSSTEIDVCLLHFALYYVAIGCFCFTSTGRMSDSRWSIISPTWGNSIHSNTYFNHQLIVCIQAFSSNFNRRQSYSIFRTRIFNTFSIQFDQSITLELLYV